MHGHGSPGHKERTMVHIHTASSSISVGDRIVARVVTDAPTRTKMVGTVAARTASTVKVRYGAGGFPYFRVFSLSRAANCWEHIAADGTKIWLTGG